MTSPIHIKSEPLDDAQSVTESILSEPSTNTEEEFQKSTKYCIFCHKFRKRGFKFKKEWTSIAFANITDRRTLNRAKKSVCILHFDRDNTPKSISKVRKRWRLKSTAVPSRNLTGPPAEELINQSTPKPKVTETETIIFPHSFDDVFKYEPEDHPNILISSVASLPTPQNDELSIQPYDEIDSSNSPPLHSSSLDADNLFIRLDDLIESWEIKESCRFDLKVSHSDLSDEIKFEITTKKSNFQLFDQLQLTEIKTEDDLRPLIKIFKSPKVAYKPKPDVFGIYQNIKPVQKPAKTYSRKPYPSPPPEQPPPLKILKSQQDIKKHEPMSCKICNKTYVMFAALRKHEEDHKLELPATPATYRCDICDSSFSKKRYMLNHRRNCELSHSTLPCKICGFKAKNPSTKSRHMHRVHAEKKFICDLCGRRYHLKSLIQTHVDSFHLQKKTYCCQYCGKSFTRYDTLFVHLKSHTTGKNVICDICGLRFYAKDKLRRHMGSHLDVRRFSCDICGKKFKRNDKINDHKLIMHFGGMKTVHGEPLKCIICRKKFRRVEAVREHMRNVHKVQRKITNAEIFNFK